LAYADGFSYRISDVECRNGERGVSSFFLATITILDSDPKEGNLGGNES